jgi:hypothetical protein
MTKEIRSIDGQILTNVFIHTFLDLKKKEESSQIFVIEFDALIARDGCAETGDATAAFFWQNRIYLPGVRQTSAQCWRRGRSHRSFRPYAIISFDAFEPSRSRCGIWREIRNGGFLVIAPAPLD